MLDYNTSLWSQDTNSSMKIKNLRVKKFFSDHSGKGINKKRGGGTKNIL